MILVSKRKQPTLMNKAADGIYRNGTGDGFREEARAAIHAAADWFEQQGSYITAAKLRMEVRRFDDQG